VKRKKGETNVQVHLQKRMKNERDRKIEETNKND